jgi:multicomponent Na+:H+ antiporter subunit G
MSDLISDVLMLTGAAFLLLAALGILRMRDVYTRLQAGTKASTLGIVLMLLALAVRFQSLEVTALAMAGIVFFFLTAPVAAHMISRAAYFVGVPLWDRTVVDELKGHYDLQTHVLESTETQATANEHTMQEEHRVQREYFDV